MRLLTRNQFMKEFGFGYEKLQKMIANKEVDYLPTADRIRVDERTVSVEQYNELLEKYTRLKTKQDLIEKILINERREN